MSELNQARAGTVSLAGWRLAKARGVERLVGLPGRADPFASGGGERLAEFSAQEHSRFRDAGEPDPEDLAGWSVEQILLRGRTRNAAK